MARSLDQILTVAQMRAAEDALITSGSSVDALMQVAGRGAAQWVWRIAANRRVTVLCGPGNNGGDGYVIAQALHEKGCPVRVIAVIEPKTEAARTARALFDGEVLASDVDVRGDILVDCLFGSGLTRPLSDPLLALLQKHAQSHLYRIAVDVPSGVEADSGALLNSGLPEFNLTLALGAWKFAHYLMPASPLMGEVRLVDIGVSVVSNAASLIMPPRVNAPPADSHKYRRGLLCVIGGEMPGATLLACQAAQGAGAGYVKLYADPVPDHVPNNIVVDENGAIDARTSALLCGPGLGRSASARAKVANTLSHGAPAVLDADALELLTPQDVAGRTAPLIATPHDGEFQKLEAIFGLDGKGTKPQRAMALARSSGMIVVAKGADTIIAAPDGQMALAPRASSWLSTAGTGDVLAGTIASRLATGIPAFKAACEGVWFHGEASRMLPSPFSAVDLARAIRFALSSRV